MDFFLGEGGSLSKKKNEQPMNWNFLFFGRDDSATMRARLQTRGMTHLSHPDAGAHSQLDYHG